METTLVLLTVALTFESVDINTKFLLCHTARELVKILLDTCTIIPKT